MQKKNKVAHCALALSRCLPPTLPLAAQLHVLLHVVFVHDAVATELADVPRLATLYGLLVLAKFHPAVKHLTTQCNVQ